MSDTPQNPSGRATLVALLVAGAFFMENLDGTVIATAIPQMAETFKTTPASLATGMTAYLVTLAVFIPASGWAADRFGARRVFTGAVALFTLASVLCGVSGSPLQFTLARILQGCGGALMTPVGRLVVLRGTAKRDLMRAIATLTWPALVAPVLGPPLGGFITSFSSWRWIFFINLPIGIAGLGLAVWLLRDSNEVEPRPFDGVGFALNGFGLALLLCGLDELGREGTDWRVACLVLAASGALGWMALRHARRHPHPLVALEPFQVPSFTVTMLSGFLSRTAISTLPFLLPLLLQIGLGMNAFSSGLLILWYGLSNICIKPFTSQILRRFGFRTVLLANTWVTAVSIAACALIGGSTPLWVTILILMLAGASRSMQFTALNTLAFAEMPSRLTASANTLFNTSFQLAVGLGVALGAITFRAAEAVTGSGAQHHAILAFQAAFLVIGAVAILPFFEILRLRPEVGGAVSGHMARPVS